MTAATTAPPATEAPDFWEWLHHQVLNSGRSAEAHARELGLYHDKLGSLLRRRSYPLPLDLLDLMGQHFGAPSEWVETWKGRALEGWSGNLGILAQAGVYTAPWKDKKCATCGTLISRQAAALCRRCYWAEIRRHVQIPQKPFQRFLYNEWRRSGMGLHAFGRNVLGVTTFDQLTKDDHQPSQATYDKLKDRYGDALPAAEVDTERRRERMRQVRIQPPAPRSYSEQGLASFRHYWASEEGRAVRRRQWARLSPQERADRTAHLRATNTRERQSLRAYLRHHPTRPSRAEIKTQATAVATRLRSATDAVMVEWLPVLEARGLWSRRGRKANEKRHIILNGLRARAKRTAAGQLPPGFWGDAASVVSQAEGKDISGPELQVWNQRHERNCSGVL